MEKENEDDGWKARVYGNISILMIKFLTLYQTHGKILIYILRTPGFHD